MLTARCASPTDDLTALWPESVGHTMNREQVFVVVDEDRLLAGLLMFHGGHSLAYTGSIVFAAAEAQGRLAHRLLAFTRDWCRARGIHLMGHGAGTLECCEIFTRLGASLTRHHLFMELAIEEKEE